MVVIYASSKWGAAVKAREFDFCTDARYACVHSGIACGNQGRPYAAQLQLRDAPGIEASACKAVGFFGRSDAVIGSTCPGDRCSEAGLCSTAICLDLQLQTGQPRLGSSLLGTRCTDSALIPIEQRNGYADAEHKCLGVVFLESSDTERRGHVGTSTQSLHGYGLTSRIQFGFGNLNSQGIAYILCKGAGCAI